MKVLLLTTHLGMGGVGVYTVNLTGCLKKTGIDVAVASAGGRYENVLAKNGIAHIKLDIRTKAEFGFSVWKALPVLTGLVRKEGFDILHAQTRVAQVLACLVEKFTGVPFVSTCHGFFQSRRLSRRLFPCWGRKVIAISESVRRHLVEDFCIEPGRIVRIYNGIDLERYSSAGFSKDHNLMKDIGLADDAIVVGAIGRLSPVKGFRYLIRAFGDVVSRERKAYLLIVGEGPEEAALKEQVRASGSADRILLIPANTALEKYLSLIDIYCVPSVNEGLGLSLMEAMAAGRPCIASDIGGMSELIVNETDGILVPAENPGALSAAILKLAGNAGFRRQLGEKAREKAAETFSIEKSAAETVEVYEEVIGGSVGRAYDSV